MINKIGMVLPECPARFASNILGGSYLPANPEKAVSRRLFAASAETPGDDGDDVRRVTETVFALVPDLENTYNPQAVAVVVPAEDGTVSVGNQIGWIPDGRCATVQPRLVSLMRATGAYAGVRATASYWYGWDDDGTERSWGIDDAHFKIRLGSWQLLHHAILDVMREAEPDVEQPWVGHRAPRSALSTKLYDEGAGAELLAVRYELVGESLVATADGEIVTNITDGGRDFFDTLHDRVRAGGPVRGWVRAQRGGVAVLHEGELPEADPSASPWS